MKLEAYMARNKLSDAQFAQLIGVSNVAVCRYRTGTRRPHWDVLQRICDVTKSKVTPNDFLEAPEEDSPPDPLASAA